MSWKNNIVRQGMAKVSEITFNQLNWRIHPKQQYEAMMGTMDEIGWVQTVIINETTGNLVDGHLRVLLAERNRETEIPATWIKVTEEEEAKILLTLDPLAAMAGVDRSKLQHLLDHTKIKDQNLKEMLAKMAAKNGLYNDEEDDDQEIPEDQTEALQKKWATALGQIWQLGRHRIMCGDSTDPANWKQLMRGEKAHMVFTDPPYGVDYSSVKTGKIKNDDLADNELAKLVHGVTEQMMAVTYENAAFYIWHASATRRDFEYILDRLGLEEIQYLVWIKDHFTMSWAQYQWQTEPCFYCQRFGERALFYGDRGQSTVWQVRRVSGPTAALTIANGLKVSDGEHQPLYVSMVPNKKKQRHVRLDKDQTVEISVPGESDAWQIARKEKKEEYYHPTQKPAALAEIAIRNSSLPEQVVIDGFLGGGCTLFGAQNTGRRCHGMDIDPRWIAAVLERWIRKTGEMPTLINKPVEIKHETQEMK